MIVRFAATAAWGCCVTVLGIGLVCQASETSEPKMMGEVSALSPDSPVTVIGDEQNIVAPMLKTPNCYFIQKRGSFSEWRVIEFSVMAEKDATVFIILGGPYVNKLPYGVYYDDLKVNGELLPNGGFDEGLKGWGIGGTPRIPIEAEIVNDERIKTSGNAVLVWREATRYQKVPIVAGKKYDVSVRFLLAGCLNVPSDVHPLSLRPVANRGFADKVEGDNAGGWCDQGPTKDMHTYFPKRKTYGGMEFDVIDPDGNNGKAVAVMHMDLKPTGLKEFTVPVDAKDESFRYLYLLHSSAWTPSKALSIGKLTVTCADGTSQDIDVQSQRDIIDWVSCVEAPNAWPVFIQDDSGEKKAVYLSRFTLPEKPLKSIRFASHAKNVWIIGGASLSSRMVSAPARREDYTFKIGDEFHKADFDNPEIVEGSILDLSEREGIKPCGAYGKAFVAADGSLRFDKLPDVPQRFMGNHISVTAVLNGETDYAKYARLMRRQGYNSIRVIVSEYLFGHYLGKNENGKMTSDGFYNAERLDKFDRFMAEIKKNGIYVYLATSSSTVPLGSQNDFKPALLSGDPEKRAFIKEAMVKLLTRVNPYTGVALKDDPMVVVYEYVNENSPGFLTGGPANGSAGFRLTDATIARIRSGWQSHLKERHKTIEALRQAFPKEVGDAKDFSEITPHTGSYVELSPWAHEFQEFTRKYLDRDLEFFKSVMKEVGYNGPITMYNMDKFMTVSFIRAKNGIPVTVNTYHSHYTPDGRTPQISSIGNGVNYFCSSANCRILGQPMMLSEYNDCERNSYSYEAGLALPAYAALQGFDALYVHKDTVITKEGSRYEESGHTVNRSPTFRACQFLAYLLYGRGDVRKSKNMVELCYSKKMMASVNSNGFANTNQAKLALILGLATKYEGVGKYPDIPDAVELPGFGSDAGGNFQAQFVEVGESKTGGDFLASTVELLRKKNILGAKNRTDVTKGNFESDTEELFIETSVPRMRVRTAKTEAIALPQDGSATVGKLTVENTSTGACVAASAMDGKNLADSERIVLLYITEQARNGSVVEANRVKELKKGKEIILKIGKLSASLKTNSKKSFVCYPLTVNGVRRSAIPVANDKGVLRIGFDTAALENGVTPFFELSAD